MNQMLSPAIVKRFAQQDDGAVAMTFAVLAVPLILFVGIAVDVNTAYHANQRATSALDSAAIAAAKQLRDGKSTPAEITATARRFFEENTSGLAFKKNSYASHSIVSVDQDQKAGRINVAVTVTVPTVFARIAGFNEFVFKKQSEAVYSSKDIEVALQLDVTGSMKGQKLVDLKAATNDLLDTLLPTNGPKPASKIRIGLAPFAAGVNAGPYAAAVAQTVAPGGCIYERSQPGTETTDAPPVGLDKFKTRAQLPAATACPTNSVVEPLTDDAAKLRAVVAAFNADGWTAGHLGSAWAWYLLSPNWSGVWPTVSAPAAYGDKNVAKYAILMTDGEYNTYGGQPGQTATSEARARALCTGMKAQKITVYTIGFQLPGGGAEQLLKDCATSVGRFYRAEDANSLRAAFKSIAQEIGGLRISK